MTGLAKVLLQASIFFVIFTSATTKSVDPNQIFLNSIVKIPTEEGQSAELPKNINTSNIFGNNDWSSNIRNDEDLVIRYIPVGNGEAILITANGYTMLLDGGENLYERQFLSYLRNGNISKIDYLVITNPSDENIGVLDNVIKNIEIDKIYAPKINRNSIDFNNLLSAMNQKNKSFSLLNKFSQFDLGLGKLVVLHVNNDNPNNINSASIVLSLEYKGKKFIFASNLDEETEKYIAWQKADILKVTSKGRNEKNAYNIAAVIKPDYAIIIKDTEGPSQKTIRDMEKVNTKILYSDKNRIVQITFDGNNLKQTSVPNTIH